MDATPEPPQIPAPSPEAIKLEIRDEVEARFGNPPKTFTDMVETEVDKRLQIRVNHYKLLIGVSVTFLTLLIAVVGGALTFYGFQIKKNIDEYVDSQLSEKGINEALSRATNTEFKIEGMRKYSEDTSNYLDGIRKGYDGNAMNMTRDLMNKMTSFDTNEWAFEKRFSQITQLDNVVLDGDIQKFFVVQMVTNWSNGNKIYLDYDPIPTSVRVTVTVPSTSINQDFGQGGFYLEGKTLLTTNESMINNINQIFANKANLPLNHFHLNIEYIRRSLH